MMLRKRFIVGLISLCSVIRLTSGDESCTSSVDGRRGACPPAWSQWGEDCYQAIAEPLMTWFEAKEECIKMGSVLVVPKSDEENAFLWSLGSDFWINCNDLEIEGLWECRDGSRNVSYRAWAPLEPNDYYLGEDCAVAGYSAWNDLPCEARRTAMCKRRAPQLHF